MNKQNLMLLLMVALIIVGPLVFLHDAEFAGADGMIGDVVTEVSPDYEPWFTTIWAPPSGEIESLLFALQAAIGAGFIGYFFGYYKGQLSRRQAHME